MVGRSATVGRLNFEKCCIREWLSGNQSFGWRPFLWDCSVFLGMNSLVFCKRKGWKRICLLLLWTFCFFCLVLPLSFCFHFTYFCYTCPFVYAVHLVVSHYFFQIKILLSSACGRHDGGERWYLSRGRGVEMLGIGPFCCIQFSATHFRPVPWLHSAVSSPFKSELLRGFGAHQHASQWYPSPCSPFRCWLPLSCSAIFHLLSVFQNSVEIDFCSCLLFTLHHFRLYFFKYSLDCHTIIITFCSCTVLWILTHV